MPRQPCFTAATVSPGFTSRLRWMLRSLGLLVPCTANRHAFRLSFSFGPSPMLRLLRPLLTSRPVSPRRPFSRKARSPQVRTRSFPARPPDLRRLIFGHESFADLCLLALIGTALYPVLVHRPAVSLHASFP